MRFLAHEDPETLRTAALQRATEALPCVTIICPQKSCGMMVEYDEPRDVTNLGNLEQYWWLEARPIITPYTPGNTSHALKPLPRAGIAHRILTHPWSHRGGMSERK